MPCVPPGEDGLAGAGDLRGLAVWEGLASVGEIFTSGTSFCGMVLFRPQKEGGENMAKKERFAEVYSQGLTKVTKIIVDTETGVHYLFQEDGYSGGLTVLVDREGKPVVGTVE